MSRIYLALDEEITGVVEKLRQEESNSVTLIVPKGAAIMQSVVNVRLLKKKADELKKQLGLVTTDPIGKHLATQVGIPVYHTIQDVPEKGVAAPRSKTAASALKSSQEQPEHVNVKRYDAEETKTGDEQKVDNEKVQDAVQEEIVLAQGLEDEGRVDNDAVPPDDAPDADEGAEVIIGREVQEEDQPTDHHEPRQRLRPSRRPVAIPAWLPRVLAVAIIVLVAASGIVIAVIPEATVTLHVPTEALKKSITLLVDTGAVAQDSTTLPGIAHEVSAETSGTAKATGKKQVGEKAKGVITISNSWSSEAQSLPKNSGLVSDKGLVFRTQADATIPGATSQIKNGQVIVTPGTVDVAVVADQPGEQYNIGSSNFSIQGYSGEKASKITGHSDKAMAGGTTKELTVVAEKDITDAKADAQGKLQAAIVSSLKQSIPADEILVTQTAGDVTYTTPDHATNDEADEVTIKAVTKATGITTRKHAIEAALTTLFKDGLGTTKSVILPEVSEITWAVTSPGSGKYELKKELEGQIVTNIDSNAVKARVRGRKAAQITETLKSDFGANDVEVVHTPPAWPLMPLLKQKITVLLAE